ncbi:MAG: hypothetical protein M2R46_05495 [Verrucomicrobia subdivision 3 bacterium]|nr:hypothetical protein [Limisphaerales bacterium]
MCLLITFFRGKTVHIAAFLKNLQCLLVLAIGRLQHQQHHTEIIFYIRRMECGGLLHDPDRIAGKIIQQLAVGMAAIGQLLFGLSIDGLVGHDPQHKTCPFADILLEDP